MKVFDLVKVGQSVGAIIAIHKKRKWTYCDIITEPIVYSSNDWVDNLVEYETYREDDITLIKEDMRRQKIKSKAIKV